MKAHSEIADFDYRVRRGELSAYGRAANSSLTLRRLALLLAFFVVAIASLTMVATYSQNTPLIQTGLFVLTLCTVSAIVLIWRYAKKNFIEPDLAFRKWLQQVCDGDLDARIELPQSHKHHKELHFHTRNLASALNRLSTEMETLVESQTNRLEYQNRCLDLMYKLTADISRESSRRTVLDTVCRYLAEWYPTALINAYLSESENPQKFSDIQAEDMPVKNPVHIASYGKAAIIPAGSKNCPALVERLTYDDLSGSSSQHRIRMPFFCNSLVVGMIVIETEQDHSSDTCDSHRVLATIAKQLNLFSERQSAIEQSRVAQMVRDRSALAAEIHDSLAQTLAALRYQVTLLTESVQNNSSPALIAEVQRIQGTVGEANQEVRGLISEFRQPLAARRFADSIRISVEAFGERSEMPVFFQTNDPQISFTLREESQLQRIIGEALMNAQKYAQSSMVRVYLSSDPSGVRRILIEDDGVGFAREAKPAAPSTPPDSGGSQIGLTIMQDRASSIGARLFIESEPGEGTRVTIELPPLSKFDGVAT